MVVTVLTKPGCVQCNATYRTLDKKGIPYRSEDVTQNPESMEKAQRLGHMRMPVVIVEKDGEIVQHWSGLNKENIEELSA